MAEYKIGEIFQYGNTWLQCVKGRGCSDCYFFHNQCEIGRLLTCNAFARSDKEDVIFKELPKELPIGFEFIYQGRKLRVEEEYDGCGGCAFEDTPQCGNLFGDVFECSLWRRKDGKPIIFRDITDESKENKHKTVKFKYMEPERKKLTIPEGWEFDRLENGEIIIKTKKPSLPTTWEDCAVELLDVEQLLEDGGIEPSLVAGANISCIIVPNGMGKAVLALCKLLICREAWWEQLKWNPDWENPSEKHCIVGDGDSIKKQIKICESSILAFPNYEVRDKFLETFKDLIEEAKELL